MTLTHKIFCELLSEKIEKNTKKQISKLLYLNSGETIIFAVSKNGCRQIYFKMINGNLGAFPECKGISIDIVKLPEYDINYSFYEISQNLFSEGYIFEIIIEDLRIAIEDCVGGQIVGKIISVLKKWQTFFSKDKSVLMSPERQQGLFGEIKMLEELITFEGTDAVFYWSGCKYETHDYYIRENAIEVKTTCKKAPYKMHISSEYQLDDNDVSGELFLRLFALRKSESGGETLPFVIDRIRDLIKDDYRSKQKFEESLREYGYFDGVADRYVTGYMVREVFSYHIVSGFPRMVKKDLVNGISNCTYDVLADTCKSYEIDNVSMKKYLGKESTTNER